MYSISPIYRLICTMHRSRKIIFANCVVKKIKLNIASEQIIPLCFLNCSSHLLPHVLTPCFRSLFPLYIATPPFRFSTFSATLPPSYMTNTSINFLEIYYKDKRQNFDLRFPPHAKGGACDVIPHIF